MAEGTRVRQAWLLSGMPGSGKDAAAAYLADKQGGFTRMALADPVKDIAAKIVSELLCPFHTTLTSDEIRALFDSHTKKEELIDNNLFFDINDRPFTPRVLAQWVGTDLARTYIHPDCWILALLNRVETQAAHINNLVITDVRFPNEAVQLKAKLVEQGYRVSHLFIESIKPSSTKETGHASESHLNELYQMADHIVSNNFGPEYFEQLSRLLPLDADSH